MAPRFTVVIPLYNKKPHLERTVESVLNQSYEDYELILVDDSSTDGSAELAARLIEGRENCRLLKRTEPGPGGYAARNLGTKEAKAEWVAFLDADDEWMADQLSEYNKLIDTFPDSAFMGSAQWEQSPGNRKEDPYYRSRLDKSVHLISLADYARAGCRKRFPIHTSAVVVKKTMLREVGGFPAGKCKRGGDRDTWLRLLAKTDFAWSPYLGSVYYRDSVNMVTKAHPPQVTTGKDDTYRKMIASEELKQRFGSGFPHLIKKLSNADRKSAYKRAVRNGTLTLKDMKHLYFFTEPLYVLTLYLWALLPGFIKRTASKLYLKRSAI